MSKMLYLSDSPMHETLSTSGGTVRGAPHRICRHTQHDHLVLLLGLHPGVLVLIAILGELPILNIEKLDCDTRLFLNLGLMPYCLILLPLLSWLKDKKAWHLMINPLNSLTSLYAYANGLLSDSRLG